jgi:hypothetical protein
MISETLTVPDAPSAAKSPKNEPGFMTEQFVYDEAMIRARFAYFDQTDEGINVRQALALVCSKRLPQRSAALQVVDVTVCVCRSNVNVKYRTGTFALEDHLSIMPRDQHKPATQDGD